MRKSIGYTERRCMMDEMECRANAEQDCWSDPHHLFRLSSLRLLSMVASMNEICELVSWCRKILCAIANVLPNDP